LRVTVLQISSFEIHLVSRLHGVQIVGASQPVLGDAIG